MSDTNRERVRQARTSKAMTQEQFAVFVGVDAKTVRNWEGGGKISPRNRQKLKNALGMDIVAPARPIQATELDAISNEQLAQELKRRLHEVPARIDQMVDVIVRLLTLLDSGQPDTDGVAGATPDTEDAGGEI